MPTRGPSGPKFGGPEDPTQKPKSHVDFSSIDKLVHKISQSEEQRLARESGELGWVNPNYFQETSQTDIPPLVPPRQRFSGTPPANRIVRPAPVTPSSSGPTPTQPIPGSTPSAPPVNPPTDLHLYSGKPEQLADMAQLAKVASNHAAYRRANRYSGKILEQAKILHDSLKGSQFENVGKQAVIAASNAYQASNVAWSESRRSRDLHKIAKITKNADDISRAEQQTKIADKARDLHEQASSFSAKFFRDIAQKGLDSVNNSIKNSNIKGNQEWYDEWIKKQNRERSGRAGNGDGGPPDDPPSGPDDPNYFDDFEKRRKRRNKKRINRISNYNYNIGNDNNIIIVGSESNIFGGGGGSPNNPNNPPRRPPNRRRRIRRRWRARGRRIARANQIQKIRTLAKIGVGASIAQSVASGDMTGAARKLAWASGNPVAIGITELALAAITAAKAMNQFSERTFESNKALSNYSGTIAYAYGSFIANEYGRKFQYATGVSETSKNLVESMDKMRNQWMRYDIASGNIANMVSSLWTRFSGGFGEPLGKETAVFAEALRTFNGMKVGGIGTGDVASAAGSAASEAGISSLWSLAGGPIIGAEARASFAWMFPAKAAPDPGDVPMVSFLKDMARRRDRDIGPALRGMEFPIYKGPGPRR